MVDLIPVAANVQQAAGAGIARGIFGATITAGQSVYLDSSNELQLAEKDGTSLVAAAVGIALNGGAPGQPASYIVSGDVDLGVTLVVGETYVVGAAPGGIAPIADVIAGNFATILGIASLANNLKVSVFQGGTAHA